MGVSMVMGIPSVLDKTPSVGEGYKYAVFIPISAVFVIPRGLYQFGSMFF